jgi:ketosteroid isomerase-like protein
MVSRPRLRRVSCGKYAIGEFTRRFEVSASEAEEVRSTVDRLVAAINDGDVETLRAVMLDDPDCIHIGSDASEWWTASEFLSSATDVNTSHDVKAETTQVSVHVKGDVAWFEGKGRFANSSGGKRDIRVTGVFGRDEENEWKALQLHVSIPVPNDQIFSS